MIPPAAMTILATIGLTQDQAGQVASVVKLVEDATREECGTVAQAQRAANAARQARWREAHKVTQHNVMETLRDVTSVTPFPQVSPPRDINSTPSSNPIPTMDGGRETKKTGRRLSEDWRPSEAHRAEADRLRILPAEIDQIAEEFRNYWLSETGQKSRKLDWERTFLNRLRDQAPRYLKLRNGSNYGQSRNGKGSLVDAGLDLIRKLDDAERRDATQAGGWPRNSDVVLLPGVRGYRP